MLTPDAFLTALYVVVDDFGKQHLPPETHPGPGPALARSEVVTLALFAQWGSFSSERAFWRYAQRHLRPLFPDLPDRSQFNRGVRRQWGALVAVGLHLAERLGASAAPYEALDGTAVVVRDAKRRGGGWLAGLADLGWSNRLGWYEGFHLLLSATREGVLTGYAFGPASTKDQALAETFVALRAQPAPALPSVGRSHPGCYVTDKGFEGEANRVHWAAAFGAVVLSPPKRTARRPWPRALRRWFAGRRQIVETVSQKLHRVFRLDLERPHALAGFHARLAAMAALHNFCLWLNRQLARPALAFADLVDW